MTSNYMRYYTQHPRGVRPEVAARIRRALEAEPEGPWKALGDRTLSKLRALLQIETSPRLRLAGRGLKAAVEEFLEEIGGE